MKSQTILNFLVFLCLSVGLVTGRRYTLSGKKIEAGKYSKRCEKDKSEILNLNEKVEIEEVATFLFKNNVNSAWIAGVKGIQYEGEVLLNVEAKRRGKYGSHTFTIIPADKVKHFPGEFFALCRRSNLTRAQLKEIYHHSS